jgi:hypothetical protein
MSITMRFLALSAVALALGCTGGDKPAPLGDSDATTPEWDAEAPPLTPKDAGFDDDAGVTFAREYDGICKAGSLPVWHFFDFKTETPQDSSIVVRMQTATTYAGLDAPVIDWAGVDVESTLQAAKLKSLEFLRVRLTLIRATDGSSPIVNGTRQRYDCILSQ